MKPNIKENRSVRSFATRNSYLSFEFKAIVLFLFLLSIRSVSYGCSTPAAITGTGSVCVGLTTNLTDATTGGTWSSSDATIGAIGSTGIVTGVAAGTCTVSYTVSGGCYVTKTATVNDVPAGITGNTQICGTSGITSLTDATSGGVWSSSNTVRAKVGSTGIVTGQGSSTGTVTITYKLTTGCQATTVVTLNPNPSGIGGATKVCVGYTISLSDFASGGAWTSSNTSTATIGSGTGIVTGVASGNATMTYAFSTGCAAVYNITVNRNPSPINGTASVCVGYTTFLSDSTPTTTSWLSSNTSVATISFSGAVLGGSAGTTTITYTINTGCYITTVLTVNALASAISGTKTVCVGSVTTLTDALNAGTWSNSSSTHATIGSATGTVIGVAPGTSTITYTPTSGCPYVTAIVTVNPVPVTTTGTMSMCVGQTTTLSDASGGGTWSSSNVTIATVGSASGIVTGVVGGTSTVSYVYTTTGCYATATVTVFALPTAISGTLSVCLGLTTSLSDSISGIWSSSSPGIATIGSGSGVATGVASGTATITFAPADACTPVYAIVTVNPLPAAITGSASVCAGLATTLNDATTGGTWSSSDGTIATIGSASGIITGVAGGTATITYMAGTGCITTISLTVNALPAGIAGSTSLCAGSTMTLSDATTGGVWSSSDGSVATIGSGSGVVAGIENGSATITYTSVAGCIAMISFIVNALPASISGYLTVCSGLTITLSDGSTGGTWSSSDGSIATIGSGSGTITGLSAGTSVITYVLEGGCSPATATVTVNLSPNPIEGGDPVFIGIPYYFINLIGGGIWSSSDTTVATATADTSTPSLAGNVTGVSDGAVTITYTLSDGCFATFGTHSSERTTSSTITGTLCPPIYDPCTNTTFTVPSGDNLCPGSTYTYTVHVTYPAGFVPIAYSWAAPTGLPLPTPSSGTGDPTGVMFSVGVASICETYTLTATCQGPNLINNGEFYQDFSPGDICNRFPCMETLYGNICSSTHSAGDEGPDHIVMNNSYGMDPGRECPLYISEDGSPPGDVCLNFWSAHGTAGDYAHYFWGQTVDLCPGATYHFSFWYRYWRPLDADVLGHIGYPEFATLIGAAGHSGSTLENGLGGGTTINVTYGAGIYPGCDPNWYQVAFDFTSGYSGTTFICIEDAELVMDKSISIDNITLYRTSGTTATGDVAVCPKPTPAALTTTTANPCVGADFTFVVNGTYLDVVHYTITYPSGSPTTGSDTIPSSGHIGVTVSGSLITTVGTLCLNITSITTPTLDGPCYYPVTTSKCVTVNSTPTVGLISGPSVVCSGVGFDLGITGTGATSFGWFSSGIVGFILSDSGSTAVAATYGFSSGIEIFSCVATNSCGSSTTTDTVSVTRSPGEINGTKTVCQGSTTTLTDDVTGGTWSTALPGVATISTSGVVTGISAGTAVISYITSPGACSITTTVTVYPSAAITGTSAVCVGSTTTLADAITGGTWYSGSPGTASVGLTTGVVAGVVAGTATIHYVAAAPSDCDRTYVVTVNPHPNAGVIAGTTILCVGATTTLTETVSGGTWTSSDTNASVGLSTGLVTGMHAGTSVISYTTTGIAPTFCTSVTTTVVTVITTPSVATILGLDSVHLGCSINLTGSPGLSSGPGGVTSVLWTDVSGTGSGTLSSDTTSATTLTSVTTGTLTVTYTAFNACGSATASMIVTVIPMPSFFITTDPPYPFDICVGGTVVVTVTPTGGGFSSTDTSVVTIGLTDGDIVFVGAGTATLVYTVSVGPGCIDMLPIPVTVNPVPAIITGNAPLCAGDTINLTDATSGGTWSSHNISVATIGSSTGHVTSITSGTTTISYTLPTGCGVATVVTVNPLPSAISGALSVCVSYTTALSDDSPGGTWISLNTGIATIDSVSGTVTGVSPGGDTIVYILPTGCYIGAVITVNPLPLPIHGIDSVCMLARIILSDSTAGGTWSSGSTTINVDGSSGTITGLHTGTAIVTYTIGTGCFVTYTISVDSLPVVPPISGTDTLCVGSTAPFSDSVSGGVWSSGNTGIVTIGSASGVATGVAVGTATLSYSVVNSCGTSVVTRVVKVYDNTLLPITGPLGVCSGSTITLSDGMTGGTWTSSDAAIATVGFLTGIVTGIASGSVTITYTATTLCGTGTATTAIVVNEIPYITTNFIVACQTLATGGDLVGPGTILPDTGCILVCDSSIVRYYGNGVGGSMFTWSVVGGIIVANYGDSIDVMWPTLGTTASITLYDTASHCIAETIACIKVIAKPHAHFFTGSTSYCLADNILFTDFSTADSSSPIVSWIWNFGDGTGTAITDPSHTYTAAGTYTVTLVVKNACNCSDTMREVLNVSSDPAPKIQCAAIVCDSETATYSTAATCGTYNWSVIGGTIVTGSGTASITVKWNDVGSDGFGYVSLATPGCSGVCSDTTTIKIPVILQSPVITGPAVVCAGEQYEYSLPLWAATQYMWGVIGYPGAVVGYRDDHTVILQFDSLGTYEIHGWYQNRIKLCGGNALFKVSVVPPDTITGQTTVCQGYTETYNLTGGASGNWVLSSVLTGSVIGTGSSSGSFTHTFGTPGAYLLSATGGFCANPLTIDVLGSPGAIDSVIGPDTVCLGRLYNYKAWNDIPGTVYSWQAIGGIISPTTVGNTVTVTWTSTGTKKLLVSHVNTFPPYCLGAAYTVNITTDSIKLNITGDTTPCANSKRGYTCNYTRGEVYDWIISPNTLGSVVRGAHAPADTILWNNVTAATTAKIIVTVHKCDSVKSDTLTVVVQPSPGVTIVAVPSPACPDSPVVFTSNTGGISYTWDFGDGTPTTTTTTNVSPGHRYPLNTTTGNIIYTVRVTVIPDSSAPCPLSGSGSVAIPILPGPVAYTSVSGEILGCDSLTTLLVGTVTNNVTGLDYQWYNGSGAISGATDTTYVASGGPQNYYFTVTASNGCSGVSEVVNINHAMCDTGGFHIHPHCDTPFIVTSSDICNSITLDGSGTTGGTGPEWGPATVPTSFTTSGGGAIAVVTYGLPGIYTFEFTKTFGVCIADTTKQDTVGIIANFRYRLKCAGGVDDSLLLTDYSAYVPWWHIDTIVWDNSGTILGGGTNLTVALPIGSYNITETVSGTRPGGTFSCTFTLPIVVPARPHAAFVDTLSPICEDVPIRFTATSTAGIVAYDWSFGDSSSNLLQDPQRTYSWSPTFTTNPHTFSVLLTVTDTIGCTADTTEAVQIYHNTLTGVYGGGGVVCSNAAPFVTNFAIFPTTSGTAPFIYLWSNGTVGSADSVYQSGSYWVTVIDSYKCQQTFYPTQYVKIIQPPNAQIYGLQNYCYGQTVNLSGYAGAGVSYAWWRGIDSESSLPYIVDAGLSADSIYQYMLVLGITDTPSGTSCYDTSAIDSINIYPLPPNPVIASPVTVVDCNTYHLELKASEIAPWVGLYNWSNGATDSVDDIYSGGPYRVWFTDLYGCISSSDTYVPLAPDTYFPYLPTGCYSLCEEQLPITLYGPPDVTFSYWAWLRNDIVAESGTSSLMGSYVVDSGGEYQWNLNNGLCAKISDTMDVTVAHCDTCQGDSLHVAIVCDTTNPATYSMTITMYSPGGGYIYTLGTDIGPIDPFSGILASYGVQPPMTLTFTTLAVPPPDSVTIQVIFTDTSNGRRCYYKRRVPLPNCPWSVSERNGHSPADTGKTNNSTGMQANVSTAMLVFPNPTSSMVTISYNYGADGNSDQSISIYDAMGRKIDYTMPNTVSGSWMVNTANWMPGVYIIRMEGDGKALQVQRLVVAH